MNIADKLGLGPKREVKVLRDGEDRDKLYEITITPPAWVKAPAQRIVLTATQYAGYLAWQQGELIHHALPSLTLSQRELLMTGLTDDNFPPEPEDAS